MAVMLVQRALIDDEITEKKAGLLLYSLQIAAANVAKTTFGQAADEDMVTETEEEEDALERLGKARESRKTLPRTNTDTRDRRTAEPVLPMMSADEADQDGKERQYIPPMDAYGRRSGPGDLSIRMDHNDQAGERGRMLPQSAGGAGGVQSNEVPANLYPSTGETCVDAARLG
jgi:hypothetical protein